MGNSAHSDWSPPPSFDGFQLRAMIGQGGMGRVYLAHEELLDRPVAIKFILGGRLGAAGRERFLNEARAVARLQHPNVVGVHRIGEVDGQPYVAYEYIAGKSLDRRPGDATWQDVLRIGLGVSRALAAAHGKGVLHRDIKPGNILETASGEIKLVDFGLAKLDVIEQAAEQAVAVAADLMPTSPVDESAESLLEAPSVSGLPFSLTERLPDALVRGPRAAGRTLTGTLLGTPLYIAPEVWAGVRATAQSDVFAVGLVLYELAASELPHAQLEAADIRQFLAASDFTPLTELRPDFPVALARIIERCLQRDPERRFASGLELLAALESLESVLVGFKSVAPPSEQPHDHSAQLLKSLQRIGPRSGEVFERVYEHLFQSRPEIRALFPSDMRAQHSKLAAAVRLVIENLRNPEHVITALEDLGRRHVSYGVDAEHLNLLGDCLLKALEEFEGPAWDESLASAWRQAYGAISRAMERGLRSSAMTRREDLPPGMKPARSA